MNRSVGGYFQFPLCALAYGRTTEERLNAIISAGVIEAGRVLWEKKFTARDRSKQYALWNNPGHVPQDFNYQNSQHVFAVAGASVIGVTLRSMQSTLAQHKALGDFHQAFIARHGPQPLVRLRASFVFEARDGTGITFEELSVLAGIYSVIGNKRQPVRITQLRIGWRALGYKTERVYAAEIVQRADSQRLFTEWKLRTTIERLHQRKLFCRSTYGRRITYYSNRLSEREFNEALIAMKTRRSAARSARRMNDDALTNAIREKRAETFAKAPASPDSDPVDVTTEVPLSGVISTSHRPAHDNASTAARLRLDFNRITPET